MAGYARPRQSRARTRRFVGVVVALLPVLCWAQGPEAASSDTPIVLQVGQTITTPQRADEVIMYVFEASAGQTYLIEIQQHGLDFIVTVEDPTGVTQSYNSILMRDESEFVLLERTQAGPFRLTVHSEEFSGADAAHSINLRMMDPDAEARAISAWRQMARGATSDSQGQSAIESDEAVDAYASAARAWAELARPRLQAQALYCIAMLEYSHRSNWNESVAKAAAAAEIYSRIGETVLYGRAMYLQGYALAEAAKGLKPDEVTAAFARALGLLAESHDIFEALGDRQFELAETKNNIGYTYFEMGEWDTARPYWQSAAQIYADLQEWGAEATPLQNLAVVSGEQGHLTIAIGAFERLLEIMPPGRLQQQRAIILDNVGEAYRQFGDFDHALTALTEALGIYRSVVDRTGEGQSLVRLGLTYSSLGDFDLAVDFLEQALPIADETNDYTRQEVIRRYLGEIAFERGDIAAAITQHELALETAVTAPTKIRVRTFLARDMRAAGRFDEAEAFATQAVREAAEAGGEGLVANALLELGLSRVGTGAYAAAAEDLSSALEVYDRLAMKDGQADTLRALARLERARVRLPDAIRHSSAALDRLDILRLGVSDLELRAFLSSRRRAYFDEHIDLLMEMYASSEEDRYLVAALEASERSRARMMNDLLSESAVDIYESAAPDVAQKRDSLYDQLADLRYQRARFLDEGETRRGSTTSLTEVAGEMASIENELNILEAALRSTHGIQSNRVLSAAEMQDMLEPGSVLIQYALGEDASYAWVVSADNIHAIRLPSRDVIERSAREVFSQINTYDPGAGARERLRSSLLELSSMLLQPARPYLAAERILVAADGALQYVPFGALYLGSDGQAPLLDSLEVVVVPSLTALAAQRARDRTQRPDKTLVVFADAVYQSTDTRLVSMQNVEVDRVPGRGTGLLARDTVAQRTTNLDNDLVRLPWTGEEARAVSALVSPDSRKLMTGFDATRNAALAEDLREYRFVHFATHGLVDSRYPALSGLAFSVFDERGMPTDGMLRLHDIFNMRLNADLVVLSACETALGREIRDEGLFGLTHGFMYAGARSMVSSLWKVSDRASMELMRRFYRNLFDGQHPAAALSAAQRVLASERRWSHPYFWAGFVLIGGGDTGNGVRNL